MAFCRLNNTGGATRPYGNLNSIITVGFNILNLGDAVGFYLNHSDRNGDTTICKNSRHAALAADYTNRHFSNLSVYGAFTRYGRPLQSVTHPVDQTEPSTVWLGVLAKTNLNFYARSQI